MTEIKLQILINLRQRDQSKLHFHSLFHCDLQDLLDYLDYNDYQKVVDTEISPLGRSRPHLFWDLGIFHNSF